MRGQGQSGWNYKYRYAALSMLMPLQAGALATQAAKAAGEALEQRLVGAQNQIAEANAQAELEGMRRQQADEKAAEAASALVEVQQKLERVCGREVSINVECLMCDGRVRTLMSWQLSKCCESSKLQI